MTKRVKLLALVVAAVLVGASQAGSQQSGQSMYYTRLYSDATYQTQVGYIYPQCSYPYVRYYLVGTFTYYAVDEYVGFCPNGVLEQPIE
jgi:hypothetical protein